MLGAPNREYRDKFTLLDAILTNLQAGTPASTETFQLPLRLRCANANTTPARACMNISTHEDASLPASV